jgi:glycosyltransferase involved in cell wall biosynthesis
MKIVHRGPYPLEINCIKGGGEASIYGRTMQLSKEHELSVIDIPRKKLSKDFKENKNGLSIFRFSAKGNRNIFSFFRLQTIFSTILKERPDVCHIHSTSSFALSMWWLLRLNHIPTIVTVHGLHHLEKKNIWKKQKTLGNFIKYIFQSITEFILISSCQILIVDTQYVKNAIETYRKQGKIWKLPICKIIPQGINEVFFQLESTPKKNTLLSVGAISRRKSHLYLIDVLAIVKQKVPDIKLEIVVTLSESSYLKLMEKKISENGLNLNINIQTNISFEEVLKKYQEAEIFVLHSEEESQGIVFCEAMAAGKPIVATNVGGIPFVVQQGVNGYLIDFKDVKAFAESIIYLLKNDLERKQIEKSNRTQSRQYDWIQIAKEVEIIYQTCKRR